MKKELKKILYIDDDEDIHFIVKICLEEIPNIELRSARSGEEGIKTAMTFQPDLILLDVMMPKMDGLSTLKVLKLLPSLTEIPVIFLTAKVQKNEIEDYFKCGVIDVIIKPFDTINFANIIQQIWTKYQLNQVQLSQVNQS